MEGLHGITGTIRLMRLLVVVGMLALVAHAGDDWLVPGGNAARNGRMADLPDTLPATPFWRHKLLERDSRWIWLYGKWAILLHDRGRAPEPARMLDPHLRQPYPTLRPTVRDGLVYYMDGLELLVRRAGSGTIAGFASRARLHPRDGTYPVEYARPGRNGISEPASEDLWRFAWYGGGAAVSSSERTVCIGMGGLSVYCRGTGKLHWAWSQGGTANAVRRDKARRTAWRKDFSAHRFARFLGCGVIDRGRLYTLAVDRQIELWCFELESGECRWRAAVQADRTFQGALGAAIAVADGVAYVCTHRGTVAAFKQGKRIWSHQYASGAPGFAYNDPIVAGDLLIIAPRDASHVTALDRATGKPAWMWKPPETRGSIAYVAGLTDEAVVLAGREVVAISLKSGKALWKPVSLQGWPYGRGFVGAKYVFLPTWGKKATIERLDIKTGARGKTIRFDVPRLGNLLWLDGRLFAAGEDELMCFTTLQREAARPVSALDRALVAALHEGGAEAVKRFAPLLRAKPRSPYCEVKWFAMHHILRLARAEKNPKLLSSAGLFATEPETKAQVAVVAAQIETGEARERALRQLETARVDVVYKGRVTRSDEVARALR